MFSLCTINKPCFHAVERQPDVAVTETLQVAAAASQTDEDVTGKVQLYHVTMGELIYQYLSHTIDTESCNLIDKLSTKHVLSPSERKKITEQKKTDAKVKSLLMMLREKSADEFESFLTTLKETGLQSVADTVHLALDVLGQAGQNALQFACGKTV